MESNFNNIFLSKILEYQIKIRIKNFYFSLNTVTINNDFNCNKDGFVDEKNLIFKVFCFEASGEFAVSISGRCVWAIL